jgi:hypothetical protein
MCACASQTCPMAWVHVQIHLLYEDWPGRDFPALLSHSAQAHTCDLNRKSMGDCPVESVRKSVKFVLLREVYGKSHVMSCNECGRQIGSVYGRLPSGNPTPFSNTSHACDELGSRMGSSMTLCSYEFHAKCQEQATESIQPPRLPHPPPDLLKHAYHQSHHHNDGYYTTHQQYMRRHLTIRAVLLR